MLVMTPYCRLAALAGLLVVTLAYAQDSKDLVTNPPTFKEADAKFHKPDVKGMPAEVWLKGYQHRLQMEQDSLWSQLKWRSIGPESQSARVVDIESPANKPGTVYVGFATSGLWRTEDDGISWTSLFEHESSFGIGDFAVSKDGGTIWLGSGENNSQRTSYAGTGIFKSTDSGKTWQNMGLTESHHIGKVIIDPKNENTVWVGALGHLYSENSERGVYKTTDGGKTWQHVLKLDQYTGVIDMVMDPRDSNVVYAAAWDRDRRAWDIRDGGTGTAVYKTADGGKTWSKLSSFPSGDVGRIGLAISPSDPTRIYAFTDNFNPDEDWMDADEFTPSGELTPRRFLLLTDQMLLQVDKDVLDRFFRRYKPGDLKLEDVLQQVKDKKLTVKAIAELIAKGNPSVFERGRVQAQFLRSDDGGKTWISPNPNGLQWINGYYYGRVFVNPADADDVLCCGVILVRSHDGGKTWSQTAPEAHVDFHTVWFDPKNPNRMAIGNDGGIYFSGDGGTRWRHWNNMPVGQFTTIAVDNKTPYNVFGGLQDNGTMKGPSNYVPGQSDPNAWSVVGWGDGSAVAVDPRDNGDIIYVASQFGYHQGKNQKSGEEWDARANDKPGEPPLRYNWVSPLIISSHHPDIIYLGAQKVFRSFDKGKTYVAISGDITKNKPNGNVPFSTIKDLSESPLQFGLIYAGCDDGNVVMTPDGGYTWTPIATPQPDKWVSRVVASRWSKSRVYCTQSGYREDDFAPYVWKSDDFGKTWTSIASNLPMETVNVLREDPTDPNRLYVGTDMGVFMSEDGGQSWEALAGALPHTPVHDIAIQDREKDMVIATHSRGVWVLSLKPIYDVTPEIRKEVLYLWSVPEMSRSNRWGYQRVAPWDKPTSPSVSGRFFSAIAGAGVLRLKDKDGKVVKEMPLQVAKGLNFFSLDLQLEPAKEGAVKGRKIESVSDALADPRESQRARFLAAGDYKLEIVVGGKTVSQDWKLKESSGSGRGSEPDPRSPEEEKEGEGH